MLGLCCTRVFSSCSAQVSHAAAWALGHVGFSSCGRWVPGLVSTGSIVVIHGPSCSTACAIFPDQGLNLCLLHWQVDDFFFFFFFFTTEPPGKPLEAPAFLIESSSLFPHAVAALFFPCLPEVLSGRFFFELLKCSVLMILVKPRRLTYSCSMTTNPFLVKF